MRSVLPPPLFVRSSTEGRGKATSTRGGRGSWKAWVPLPGRQDQGSGPPQIITRVHRRSRTKILQFLFFFFFFLLALLFFFRALRAPVTVFSFATDCQLVGFCRLYKKLSLKKLDSEKRFGVFCRCC